MRRDKWSACLPCLLALVTPVNAYGLLQASATPQGLVSACMQVSVVMGHHCYSRQSLANARWGARG